MKVKVLGEHILYDHTATPRAKAEINVTATSIAVDFKDDDGHTVASMYAEFLDGELVAYIWDESNVDSAHEPTIIVLLGEREE